jgi:hypothetical protein
MHLNISLRASMELRDLVNALLQFDTLTARQWVADAERLPIQWPDVGLPAGLNPDQLAVAAGVAELLAQRMGQQPPAWTSDIAPSITTIYLVRSARTMPRLRQLCEQEGPEPLRRRHILAPPEFLTIA